jgi:hypothetical protein
LKAYTDAKKLTVNTGKCEIVAFGAPLNAQFSFKFGDSSIPVVRRCKYLGVYFDQITLLGAHADHLTTGFQNAVGAFFRLGRKLNLSELPTWRLLQNSLLFSVLYGIELLDTSELLVQLETQYRKALRAFIGLPNRVSNNVLDLLFPDFSFLGLFLKKKHGFLRRMTSSSATLAPAFFLEDRTKSFPAGVGFSAEFRQELEKAGLEELIWDTDRALASFALSSNQDQVNCKKWVEMAGARSTRFLVIIFGERSLWHEFQTFAANINRASLRICLLSWTGSIEVSSTRQARRRCPFCHQTLDTRHYFLCGREAAYQLELVSLARNRKWPKLIRITFDIYFRFLFGLHPSVLTDDEAFLVEWGDTTDIK